MESTFDFLSDEDLDWLDAFLLSRFDDEAEFDPDVDEGVLCVSELDGFFTAIVSGPVMIHPSEWIPAIWGDVQPERNNEEELLNALSLFMQHMNIIAATLMTQPDYFEALFLEKVVEDQTYTIVDEWCVGYMRGVVLAAEQWELAEKDMQILLAPIMAFSGEAGLKTHENFSQTEIEHLQKSIIPHAREIHAYWLARRLDEVSAYTPVQRAEPRVGRNAPCPCGSGKKYKKCCLH